MSIDEAFDTEVTNGVVTVGALIYRRSIGERTFLPNDALTDAGKSSAILLK